MAKYIVTGGTPLRGTVQISGAKNAGFKLLIASLMGNSPSTIRNVGLISEIDIARDNIISLGGKFEDCGDHCFRVDPAGLNNFTISPENGAKSRSCTMYAPVLLHKFGKAVIPAPGGDRIGARPLERHYKGLEAMGAEISTQNEMYVFKLRSGYRRLRGTRYRFEKNTHTGTETLLLAAVMAEGQTILENAAQEPEIDNLIELLNKMGGKVLRNVRTIIIDGVETLSGAQIKVIPDRNEAVAFGCIALGTRGDVRIQKVRPEDLTAFIGKVKEIGGGVEISGDGIRIFYRELLKSTNVETSPHPGFMSDWQSVWTTLMTQCRGESVVHETVYESRFGYVSLLQKMGANIELFRPDVENPEDTYNFNLTDDKPENPHAARVFGPAPLHGEEVEIKDIRAGAAILFAGLMASGQTVIADPLDQIKRGYEDLPGKLKSLGAKVEVI